MNYRDSALAAYQALVQKEADAAATARQILVAAAKDAVRPLYTGADGKSVLDPTAKITTALVDRKAGLVILTISDGSDISFAVFPNKADEPIRMADRGTDGEWSGLTGPVVTDLGSVGAALTGGEKK